MRLAPHDIGRAHQHAHAGLVRGLGGIETGREFGELHTVADRLVHMRKRRIVMAGDSDAVIGADLCDGDAMRRRIAHGLLHALVDEDLEGLVGKPALLLVVENVLVHRLELPLARSMVHQRNEPDIRVVGKIGEVIEHIVGRNFAAKVDKMLGPKAALALGGLDGVCHGPHLALLEAAILVRSHPQAVEHGGDAGRSDLCVMRLDRRRRIPAHARTWRIVLFQMVGMQLDKPGDQIIALEVLAGLCRTLGNVCNLAVPDLDGAGHDAVLQHDAGICEYGLDGHGVVFLISEAGARGSQR